VPDTHRPTDAQRIAPDVDPRWVDAFVLEARLRDVPGERIGDALAEVGAHCRDSGEPAGEAFGDPAAYARAVAETYPAPRPAWLPHLAPLVVEIAGMVVVITAVGELARGREVTVTWGLLAMLAVLVAGCGLVALLAGRVLELVVRRPLVAAAAVGAGATAVLVPSVLLLQLDAPVAVVPAPGALAAGLLLLGAGIAADVLLARRGRTADPVVGPGQEPAPRRAAMLLPWTVLAWTAVGSVVVGVAGAVSGG